MENFEPKVSVVMPVYNAEAYLRDSIESVLNQTLTDFEFIIINDGSTDNSKAIIQEYSDNRIKLIENNHNYIESLNKGMKLSKALYIARMDADDRSHKKRLEREITYLKKNPQIAFVGCASWLLEGDQIWGIRRMKEKPTRQDFLWGNPFMHPTICIRKTVLEEVGGYYVSRETRRLEDYDLFMRLYEKGYYGVNLKEPYYYFFLIKRICRRRDTVSQHLFLLPGRRGSKLVGPW